ncbi:MAG: hypothetical protein WBA10_16785 [Elainellaceae cyanobacterium]
MVLTSIATLSLLQGCLSSAWLRNTFLTVSAEMEVTKLNTQGSYQVSGTIDLPDRTPMGVAALRYLTLNDPIAQNTAGRRVYTLLDYTEVKVSNGTWQTNLDLWQVGADGLFQESWQGYSDRLDWSVTADDEVVFITIPTPTKEIANLEQRLRNRQQRLDDALLRQTFDGVRYAEVAYLDDVPLPEGSSNTLAQDPQAINGGWGRRYILQPEPANPNTLQQPSDRRTTAPPSPAEFLR